MIPPKTRFLPQKFTFCKTFSATKIYILQTFCANKIYILQNIFCHKNLHSAKHFVPKKIYILQNIFCHIFYYRTFLVTKSFLLQIDSATKRFTPQNKIFIIHCKTKQTKEFADLKKNHGFSKFNKNENLFVANFSLGSCEVPHKIWRLLDTN